MTNENELSASAKVAGVAGYADIRDYDESSARYAIYGSRLYPVVGLSGEVGEFTDKVAKLLRRSSQSSADAVLMRCTNEQREDLLAELGDILWMLAACARELDSSLEDIARTNIVKLQSRKERGVIDGSGDKR